MTNLEQSLQLEEKQPKKAMPMTGRIKFLLFALFFLIAVACGAALKTYIPVLLSLEPAVAKTDKALIDQLDLRMKALEGKLGSMMAEGAAPKGEGGAQAVSGGPDSQDLELLKESLAGLSGALGVLQTQLEKSSEKTNVVRVEAQTGLATVLSFVQMQNAAMAGHLFEKERQALRQVAGEDQTMIDYLLKLEKPALVGVPDAAKLMREWRALAGEMESAMRKTAAQTWQDRVVVALEGLVSIRALNPKQGETLSFAAIDGELSRGDIAAALEKVAALPQEAQKVVADWRAKAEMRRDMEATLAELAAYLIVRDEKKETPQAEAPPSADVSAMKDPAVVGTKP